MLGRSCRQLLVGRFCGEVLGPMRRHFVVRCFPGELLGRSWRQLLGGYFFGEVLGRS